MSKLVDLTDGSFKETVLESDLPVLVDFWAAWCMPCKKVTPVVEAITSEYAGKLKTFKLDVDSNPQSPVQFGVMGIPTLLLFKDGQAVERITGKINKERVLAVITPHLD